MAIFSYEPVSRNSLRVLLWGLVERGFSQAWCHPAISVKTLKTT